MEPDWSELTLLTVPDCPNAAVFEERLAAALASCPHLTVRRREIADEQEAAEAGMCGLPTLLVNGVDPFAAPGLAPGLAGRLYRDAAGGSQRCRRPRPCGGRWSTPVRMARVRVSPAPGPRPR